MPAHVRRVVDRVLALQIDPINVVMRSQYVPVFSRVGPYVVAALDALAYEKHELFEYYGHRASLLPISLYPLFRWRMDLHKNSEYHARRGIDRSFAAAVLDQVEARGPIAASDLADRGRRGRYSGGWAWNDGKRVLSGLLVAGLVAVAGRRGMEQLYDVTERVIPRSVLDVPAPDPDDAKRELLVLATRAMGVATASDLEDYFSIGGFLDRRADPGTTRVRALLADLVEDGRLVSTRVEGWRDPAYVLHDVTVPSRIDARALLSPFDSMIWERKRTARLFAFDYRIEIYVPEPQRVYGYYVLPFLLGDALVARVDLKADRGGRILAVRGAFAEPGVDARLVAGELVDELRAMATWLALERVEVGDRGDLARALQKRAM